MFRTIKTILVNQGQINSVNIKALFALGFLDKAHISVYTGYQDDEWFLPEGATKEHNLLSVQWVSSTTALITVPLGVTEIKIRRKVPKDIIYTNFEGNAALTRKNLNDAQRQWAHILEEIDDNLYTYNQIGGGDSGNITIPNASETVRGILKLATSQLVTEGLDDETAVTPLKQKNYVAGRINDMIESFGFYTSTGIISGLEVTKVNPYTINISAGTSFIVDPVTNTKNYYLSAERTITMTQFDLIGIKYVKAVLTDGGLDIQFSVTPSILSGDYRSIILGVIYPMQANVVDRGIAEIVDLRKYATQTNNMVYELAYKPVVESFSLSLVNESLVVNNDGLIVGRAVNGKNPEELRDTLVTYVTNATSRHMCQNVLHLIDNGFSNIWHTNISAFKSLMTDNKFYWLDVALDGKMNIIVAYNPIPYDTIDLAYSNATNSYIDKATRTVTHKILVSKVGSAYTYSKLFKCTGTGDIIREATESTGFTIDQMPIGTVLEATPEVFSDKWVLCDGSRVPVAELTELAVSKPNLVRDYPVVSGTTVTSETLCTIPTAVQTNYEFSCGSFHCQEGNHVYTIFGFGDQSTNAGFDNNGYINANSAFSGVSRTNLTTMAVEYIGEIRRPSDLQRINMAGCGKSVKIGSRLYFQYSLSQVAEIKLTPIEIIEGSQTLDYLEMRIVNLPNYAGTSEIIDLCNANGTLCIVMSHRTDISTVITPEEDYGTSIYEFVGTDFVIGNIVKRITIKSLLSINKNTIVKGNNGTSCYNNVDNAFYLAGLNNISKLNSTFDVNQVNNSSKINVFKIINTEGVWSAKKIYVHTPKHPLTAFYNNEDSGVRPVVDIECVGANVYIKILSKGINNYAATPYIVYRKNGQWNGKLLHAENYTIYNKRENVTQKEAGILPSYTFLDENNIFYNDFPSYADSVYTAEVRNTNKLFLLRNWDTNLEDDETINGSKLNIAIDETDATNYRRRLMTTFVGHNKVHIFQNYTRVTANASSVTFKILSIDIDNTTKEVLLPSYQDNDTSLSVIKYIKAKD